MRTALVALALASTAATAATGTALPADAARVAARIEACMHFAGEFNGDRSERDREVTRRMRALHCERIRRDADAIRRRYARDAAVQRAMDGASEL